MIVRNELQLAEQNRVVNDPNGEFVSMRYLNSSDEVGYTMTKTTINKGLCKPWHYTNHFESCLCVKGFGRITDLQTNETFNILPGTMYSLNKNEKHQLEVFSETMALVCVFNPALVGHETHDKNGVYGVAV